MFVLIVIISSHLAGAPQLSMQDFSSIQTCKAAADRVALAMQSSKTIAWVECLPK